MIINVHLGNFRNLSGNLERSKPYSSMLSQYYSYAKIFGRIISAELWCGPGGENGDLINPFGSPKWCPENPCGSSQSLVGWGGRRWLLLFGKIFLMKKNTSFVYFYYTRFIPSTSRMRNFNITILSYEWFNQFYIFFYDIIIWVW